MKRTRLIIAAVVLVALGMILIVMANPESKIDPVCQMSISEAQVTTAQYNGQTYYFCSDQCKQLFLANPAQYCINRTSNPVSATASSSTSGIGCGTSVKRASCGGCPAASSCFTGAAAPGSDQSAQKSSNQEVNEFYAIFHPMYMAAQKGNVEPTRKSIEQLIKGAEALNKCEPPKGVSYKEFKKARKVLQKGVKELAKICKQQSDNDIIAHVNTVYGRYIEFRSFVP